jgi:Ca2+/Na+ antiporter
MLDDLTVETAFVETTLARKRAWNRWMWAIVSSGLVTALACGLTPLQFASSEQLLLSLSTIFASWFVFKVVASRGKFRFVSMLGMMALTAFLCIYIVAPLRDRAEQNTAIETILSQGGTIEFGRFSNAYPKGAMGWVPGKNGIPYPAALYYFEQNYLLPSHISKLVIPSGLVRKPFLSSLHVENLFRMYVLLDGKGNTHDFEQCIRDIINDRSIPEKNGYRPFFFVIDDLQSKDIDFLKGVRTHASDSEMPTLCIGSSLDANRAKLLEGLDRGFELYLEPASIDDEALRNVIQCKTLQRVVCFNQLNKSQFISAINSRREPLESLHIPFLQFSKAEWSQLCSLTNVRSLLLYRCFCEGKQLSMKHVAELRAMSSLAELKIELEGPDPTGFLETLKNENLKRLTVYSFVDWNDEVKEAIQTSGLEQLSLAISEQIDHEPWMNRFQSFRINGREYARP